MTRLFALVCLLVASSTTAQANEGDCANSEGECPNPETTDRVLTEDEKEIELGLNALPVHIAAVTGQLTNVQQCGPWCAEAEPKTACRMDTDIVPCQGDFYCTTTCALWHRSVLMDPNQGADQKERPTGTCAMFSRFDGYGSTEMAEPCDTSCLLPESAPTAIPPRLDWDSFVKRIPATPSLRHWAIPYLTFPLNCYALATGLDPIVPMTGTLFSPLNTQLRLGVTPKMPSFRPPSLSPRKIGTNIGTTLCLAFASQEEGTLQILTAPPDKSLHIQTRSVAERVRKLPNGPIQGGNLYVNPSIAGFFNNQWTFLLPFLQQNSGSVKHVVLLSTGAGLSGTISAVQALLSTNQSSVQIHLYHGIRRSQDLPFEEYLQKVNSQIQLTIVESQKPKKGNGSTDGLLDSAFERGRAKRKLLVQDSWLAKLGLAASGKLYVQNVVEQELNDGTKFTLDNSLFVACGRLALLEETKEMLIQVHCSDADNAYECSQRVGQRFFTNI